MAQTVGNFRPDIEGLRGFAVLAVVLFHAGFSSMSGGYVGVDVFFVISGFLITGIISRQVSSGTFNFGSFYARRLRRLYPAVLVTTIVTFAIAVFLFSPSDLERTSGEAIFSSVALSNVYFWLQAGYFDAEGIKKPLLHTWSLAVEEQFYLIWPAFIYFASKAGRAAPPIILAAIALFSFSASQFMLKIDPSAAFFLVPFRIFEFGLGASLVMMEGIKVNKWAGQISFLSGVGVYVYSVFCFNEHTSFPGINALVPCFAAVMMIYGGKSGGAAYLVTNPVMRYLGKISYSVYLVHWPIAVFVSYVVIGDLTLDLKLTIVILSFIFALLLYYGVEKRFRAPETNRKLSPLAFSLACAATLSLVVPIMLVAWVQDGWQWRKQKADLPLLVTENIQRDYDDLHLERDRLRFAAFEEGKQKWLIVGDSMSADLVNILRSDPHFDDISLSTFEVQHKCMALFIPAAEKDYFFGKANTFTAEDGSLRRVCESKQESILHFLNDQKPDAVLLANLWKPFAVPFIANTVKAYEQISKAPVFVVGRKDLLASSEDIYTRYTGEGSLTEFASQFRNPEVIAMNQSLEKELGERYINLYDTTCPTNNDCMVIDDAGNPYFVDKSHLGRAGVAFFGERLAKRGILQKITESSVSDGPFNSALNDLTSQLKLSVANLPTCRPGIEFEGGNWHDCESAGRWLGALSGIIQIDLPSDASSIRIEGRFWGQSRNLRVTENGATIFDGPMIDKSATILLNGSGLHELTLEFDGGDPGSPADLGRDDDRKLVFMLQKWYFQ